MTNNYLQVIVGLPGKDPSTNINYPAFTMRTFIENCQNQSGKRVSYGGAIFQGRIQCCRTDYCNTESKIFFSYLNLKLIHESIVGFIYVDLRIRMRDESESFDE